MAIALRLVHSVVSFATMGKRPGRGSRARKQAASQAKYEEKRSEKDSTNEIWFNLVGSKPRLLSDGNEDDCQFAIKFAEGVRNELWKIKEQQEQYETIDINTATNHLRTVF